MNIVKGSQAENAAEPNVPGSPTIDQVRELLFGQEQRTLETQIKILRSDMERMQSEYENRLIIAERDLQTAISTVDADYRDKLNAVGEAVQNLGKLIQSIANK